MKLDDLHNAVFEFNSDTYLTFEQAWRAKDWMKKHLFHVFNLIKNLESGYAPTLQEDKNNPALWKPQHWIWFIQEYIKE
jgi:hypothetical protein